MGVVSMLYGLFGFAMNEFWVGLTAQYDDLGVEKGHAAARQVFTSVWVIGTHRPFTLNGPDSSTSTDL